MVNQSDDRYMRDLNNFYRYLNWMRQQQDLALDGLEWRGEYEGDGVARYFNGEVMEPLDWDYLHHDQQSEDTSQDQSSDCHNLTS